MTTKEKKRTKVPVRARPVRQELPVALQGQEHRNWCWAACCQTVLGFRGRGVTQGELADQVPRLGGGCRTAPLPVPCDNMLTATEITSLLSPLRRSARPGPKLSDAALRAELAAGRPIMIGYDWGHICLVYGTFGAKFAFFDPAGGARGDLSFAALNRYHDEGDDNVWSTSWTGL